MEVGGGFICEVPDCVTEGGSSPGPVGAGLFPMPGFRPDAQKSGPRPPQRGGTSQPLHGTNNFFADLSKFFLTFAVFRKILPAFPAVPSGAAFLCAAGRRQTKVCRRPAVLQSVGFPSGQSWTSRRRLTAAESWMVRTLAPATYLPTAAVLFFTGVMVPAPATQPPGQPIPSNR